LLVLSIAPGIEDNAITGFNLHFGIQFHEILSNFLDKPHKRSSLFTATPVD
jgi:hypothetical protein